MKTASQKGFAVYYILVIALILVAIGSGVYYLGLRRHTVQENTYTPSQTPTPTSSTNTTIAAETNNFPVYPGASFVKKETTEPCRAGKESGFSDCGSTVYTWYSADDYNLVSDWFQDDPTYSGWKCHGGAGLYVGPRHATGSTSCTKGNLIYGLNLSATSSATTIMLVIAIANIRYTNDDLGISFVYPKELIYIYDESNDFVNKGGLNG